MQKSKLLLLGIAVASLSFAVCDLSSWTVGLCHEEHALAKARECFQNDTVTQPSLREINSDYVCWLECADLGMELPVVQGREDAFYLKHAFDQSESELGTPFFEASARLDDPVRIIYGHYVNYDAGSMFSPLQRLTREDMEAAEFTLAYENYKEAYQITHVFTLAKDNDAFALRKHSFSCSEDFQQWIAYADEKNQWKNTELCSAQNTYILLQTCTKQKNEFLIVIGKKKTASRENS